MDKFYEIRDLPYRIATALHEDDFSCYSKHLMMKEYLEEQGILVRPILREFHWEDVAPKSVLEFPHDKTVMHLYLQVRNRGWHNLDLTFDKGLERFLVVNDWDGRSSTEVAVHGQDYSPERSLEIFSRGLDIKSNIEKHGRFYVALNAWFEQLRTHQLE